MRVFVVASIEYLAVELDGIKLGSGAETNDNVLKGRFCISHCQIRVCCLAKVSPQQVADFAVVTSTLIVALTHASHDR